MTNTQEGRIHYLNEHEDRVLAVAIDHFHGEYRDNLMALDAADLQGERTRWLLRTVQRMARLGQPVDLLAIQEAMAKQKKERPETMPFGLDLAWLVDLMKESYQQANHLYYCKHIKKNAHRIRLDEAITRVNQARETGMPVEEAAQAIIAEFQRYELATVSNGPVILGELLPDVYEGWRARTDGEAVGLMLEAGGLGEAFGLMKPGELVIVAGRPGSGKTEVAVTVTSDIGIRQRRPVLYLSLEMNATDMAERFWLADSRLSVDAVDRDVDAHNDALAMSKERLDPFEGERAPIYIQAPDMMDIGQVVAAAERWAASVVNPAAVVVDYVGLLKVGTGHQRHDLAIAEMTGGLKRLAKRLGLPVISLVQLSRDVEKRANKRPVNSDLRDSGSIEQDADKIVMVYRDAYYDKASPLGELVELLNTKRRRGKPTNGYCHFINGHLAPIGNQDYAAQQVADHIANLGSKKEWA